MLDTKECTLMFYFASDNPLAISIVSQLKAIKAAGFHKEANVIVQFDPFTEGTPTHVFDVNVMNKIKADEDCETDFAGDDPFVLNLIDDKLWNGERTRNGKFIKKAISELVAGYDPPAPPAGRETINGEHHEFGPQRSLARFLEFCSYAYPAKHYMLFILGHGVVVGNDVFLFDENADEHSLKLATLGNILRTFSADVKLGGGSFDLLGFHSCSVSSLEVAYELQDTAKYMLASQGTAFVGSWPYRQMLKRVFNGLNGLTAGAELNEQTLKEMLIDLFFFCMHNSTDFLLAGYPFDLSLCDLSKISTIREPVEKLAKALVTGLEDTTEGRHCADLIVLAHWRAQSFYQEMYTDLYDFCFCLREKLKEFAGTDIDREKEQKETSDENKIPQNISLILQNIFGACNEVILALEKERQTKELRGGQEKLIICSEFAGPESQYSHGLSVYFPWSTPNPERRILEEYSEYKVSGEEFETTWLDFLNTYWNKTMRQPSRVEQNKDKLDPIRELYEDKISLVYTQEGPRNSQNALTGRGKIDSRDPTGGDCDCPSIKNYPHDIRDRRERRAADSVTVSENFLPTAS